MKDGIIEAMEQAQESAIRTRINVVEEVDMLTDLVAAKIEGLKLVDKERGLFTLATNRSKDTMVFPPKRPMRKLSVIT